MVSLHKGNSLILKSFSVNEALKEWCFVNAVAVWLKVVPSIVSPAAISNSDTCCLTGLGK